MDDCNNIHMQISMLYIHFRSYHVLAIVNHSAAVPHSKSPAFYYLDCTEQKNVGLAAVMVNGFRPRGESIEDNKGRGYLVSGIR